MAQNVLVLGGTGFVGRSLCERLAQRGGRIVVPTRRLAHGRAVQSLPTVELVEADVHDEATLVKLLAGTDAVVNLVAILHGSPRAFAQVHAELPRRLAHACAVAGVCRVVHVSALGAAADAPSNYLRSKAAGETLLQAAGLDLTLLRPSVVFGAHDRFLNLFSALQRFAPLLPLAGRDARFQPVWVEDLTTALVRCLDRRASIGKTYEIAGPQTYSLGELVRLAGRWSGHERPQFGLPAFAARLQALLLEALPGPTLMSRDNLDSMRVPNVATGDLPGLADLDLESTALEAVAPRYLGGGHGAARFDLWRARRA